MEPGLLHLVGDTCRILRQLRQRDVAVDDVEPSALELGLEPTEPPQIDADRHDDQIGLVAEGGDRDDLVVIGDTSLDRGVDRLSVGVRSRAAEQVEDAESDRWLSGCGHGDECRDRLWWALSRTIDRGSPSVEICGRVHIRCTAASEADERQTAPAGRLDRERRGRGHRDKRAEPGGPRLLDQFEARPTAHEQALPGRGKRPVEKQATHHLVDGVVASDVLADVADLARSVERRRRVHGSGGLEQGLALRHLVGHADHDLEVERCRRRERIEPTGEIVESRGATHPARRRHDADTGFGAGAFPPVSTVTTLNSLSTADPVAQ